ncbi:MAG TPA: glycerate kinase [Candidatus Binatia bacterium]
MPSLVDLRVHAREIFFAGLSAADPLDAIHHAVQREGHWLKVGERSYDLDQFRRIYITGGGKAAAKMALAVEKLIGDRIAGGIVVVKYGHAVKLGITEVIEAGHPVPDDAGLNGARRIAELVQSCDQNDLVFLLLCGGGSALLPYPAQGLSLSEKQRSTQALLESGADIFEINAVRKHLSRLKGGQLARLAAPAMLVSLVLSDVIDDSLETIASGPTVPDRSTFSACLDIIRRYQLAPKIPSAVLEHLKRGARGEIAETPKDLGGFFERVQNVIIGNIRTALSSAFRRAEELGYQAMICSEALKGESRVVGRTFASLLKAISAKGQPTSRPACVLSGGETTVTVRGDGLGGRNQEFALAAALELSGVNQIVVLSAGTDGTDGPTNAAGGIVDGKTVERAMAHGLDAAAFLARNDSYHLLQATQDLLFTGPTLTNVMDLQIGLVA